MDKKRNGSLLTTFRGLGGASLKFVLVDKVLGVVTRFVDGTMIYFIAKDPAYGAAKAFVLGGALNLLICSVTVWFSNHVSRRYDIDITGIGDLKAWSNQENDEVGGVFLVKSRQLVRWILNRRSTIFWVGSWFHLDPDYVTLLLQDKRSRFTRTITTITFPSVVIATSVWTAFYWVTIRATGIAEIELVKAILSFIDG